MIIIRLAKIVMVASLAAFAFIVTYDNIVDYDSNYEFVRHVLSMDTTFPGNALMDRAITDPRIWEAAYAVIIAAEGLTSLLLTIGAVTLLTRLRATRRRLQSRQSLGGGRPDCRFLPVVLRLPGGGRRVFRHVAVENLERGTGSLPIHHGDPRRVDFCQSARRRRLIVALNRTGLRLVDHVADLHVAGPKLVG